MASYVFAADAADDSVLEGVRWVVADAMVDERRGGWDMYLSIALLGRDGGDA